MSSLFFYQIFLAFCFLSRGVVPQQLAKTITVGSGGDFNTVQAAVDSIPENNKEWIKIHIKAGVYNEKVGIAKGFLYLEGEGREQTIISWDDHANTTQSAPQHFGSAIGSLHLITTETSATFTVSADSFVARGITFRNHYGTLTRGPRKPAVALSVSGDKSSFYEQSAAVYECGFVGIQDTLLDYHGRHLFSSCYIEGAVDFIFGYAQSIYEDCTLNVSDSSANVTQGYITAHGRGSPDSTGFVFLGGTVEGDGSTYLGRAWGNHSRVLYVGTVMSQIVVPQGWDQWQSNDTSKLYYAELNCTGPGSNTSQRVPWEAHPQAAEVSQFTSFTYIDSEGWLGQQPRLTHR